jgi:hypothetical protein
MRGLEPWYQAALHRLRSEDGFGIHHWTSFWRGYDDYTSQFQMHPACQHRQQSTHFHPVATMADNVPLDTATTLNDYLFAGKAATRRYTDYPCSISFLRGLVFHEAWLSVTRFHNILLIPVRVVGFGCWPIYAYIRWRLKTLQGTVVVVGEGNGSRGAVEQQANTTPVSSALGSGQPMQAVVIDQQVQMQTEPPNLQARQEEPTNAVVAANTRSLTNSFLLECVFWLHRRCPTPGVSCAQFNRMEVIRLLCFFCVDYVALHVFSKSFNI